MSCVYNNLSGLNYPFSVSRVSNGLSGETTGDNNTSCSMFDSPKYIYDDKHFEELPLTTIAELENDEQYDNKNLCSINDPSTNKDANRSFFKGTKGPVGEDSIASFFGVIEEEVDIKGDDLSENINKRIKRDKPYFPFLRFAIKSSIIKKMLKDILDDTDFVQKVIFEDYFNYYETIPDNSLIKAFKEGRGERINTNSSESIEYANNVIGINVISQNAYKNIISNHEYNYINLIVNLYKKYCLETKGEIINVDALIYAEDFRELNKNRKLEICGVIYPGFPEINVEDLTVEIDDKKLKILHKRGFYFAKGKFMDQVLPAVKKQVKKNQNSKFFSPNINKMDLELSNAKIASLKNPEVEQIPYNKHLILLPFVINRKSVQQTFGDLIDKPFIEEVIIQNRYNYKELDLGNKYKAEREKYEKEYKAQKDKKQLEKELGIMKYAKDIMKWNLDDGYKTIGNHVYMFIPLIANLLKRYYLETKNIVLNLDLVNNIGEFKQLNEDRKLELYKVIYPNFPKKKIVDWVVKVDELLLNKMNKKNFYAFKSKFKQKVLPLINKMAKKLQEANKTTAKQDSLHDDLVIKKVKKD